MGPPPVVTGLSPNEGPPGTRIKIRGENFGKRPQDLIGLTICGVDCLLSSEWKSENKIIAISGPVKTKGEVIVTTRTGGVGTCNVTFKGYHETIGPMKESAVWVEEETPMFAWGRHSLSPSSYQQEDPLGLSVEGNEKKFPVEDLINYFPGHSGDVSSTKFSPGWFLLENHHLTSFNDLQAGLLHLRRKVEGQKEGQLSFLKANIGSVIDQADTLVSLKEKYEKDLPKYGLEPTVKLERSIKESEREGKKLFDDVLARRERADKTRNALNVLTRFKFLFCLPCVLDRNIKRGDYDIVINDYIRVKNLFNKTDVHVFKTALNEIEKRIIELQNKLHIKLQTMPITVEQQKRLIRYLVNLDSPHDAAWDAIISRSDFINKKIISIYNFHKRMDENEGTKPKPNSASKYLKYNTPTHAESANTVPVNLAFIDEICLNISETFPDLWRLGQAYFSGELRVKIEPGRHLEYKRMVMSIIESFCKLIRLAIIPWSISQEKGSSEGGWSLPGHEETAPYLPELLRSVRTAHATFLKLDLPNEALDIVSGLLLDLRVHSVGILFQQTAQQVKHFNENWKIGVRRKNIGITELPLRLEQLIQDVIQIIKESILLTEQREGSLLEEPLVEKELERQLEAVFKAFYDVLNNLSWSDDSDDDKESSSAVSQLIGTPVGLHSKMHDSTNTMPLPEQKLLIILSNCVYTRETVVDNVLKMFTDNGFLAPNVAIKNSKIKLLSLEKSILDKYLEQKSDPLVGTIEPSMYLGHFDWDTVVTPTDIRPYAKECINNLIHIHAEVNNISPGLLQSVLPQIVQIIAEELYRLMSCVQKFSKAGSQQASIDIMALQEFFLKYTTPKAKNYFGEALDIVPKLEKSEFTIVEDILKQCRIKMKVQLLCLSHQVTDQ